MFLYTFVPTFQYIELSAPFIAPVPITTLNQSDHSRPNCCKRAEKDPLTADVCLKPDLETDLCLFIQSFQWIRSVWIGIISAAAGVIRVMLFLSLLLSVCLGVCVLCHGVDLSFGGIKHDGEDL